MSREIGSRYQQPSGSALEERVHVLENRVATLAEAVTVLARGLEDGPMAEPGEHRVVDAARKAHDLLLAATAATPRPGDG